MSSSSISMLSPGAGPDEDWAMTPAQKLQYSREFNKIQRNNEVGGYAAQGALLRTGLQDRGVLAKIWELADISKSGSLRRDEFAIAMHIATRVYKGARLPLAIPIELQPAYLRNKDRQEMSSAPPAKPQPAIPGMMASGSAALAPAVIPPMSPVLEPMRPVSIGESSPQQARTFSGADLQQMADAAR